MQADVFDVVKDFLLLQERGNSLDLRLESRIAYTGFLGIVLLRLPFDIDSEQQIG